MIIRENIEKHMEELKAWLAETADDKLEDMDGFFTERIENYEEHMSIWREAYIRFAGLLPDSCKALLDLGCGTGLELDEIWKRNPDIEVTGVDLCQSMLDKLLKKHSDKKLTCVCADYFEYDFGGAWDAVISFESLHHFLPEKKKKLYQKIYDALKSGGCFVLGDYIACCAEEEELLQQVCLEKRKRDCIPAERFVHFDIPLTLEHELELLRAVGFKDVTVVDSIAGATLLIARK